MKKFLLLLSSLLSLMLAGCYSTPPVIPTKSTLVSVERPKEVKEKYGEIKISEITEEEQEKMVFEDDLIKAKFYLGQSSIAINLENKSDYTMKINWDNSAFINESGVSQRVIHSGVRLIDRNSPQASTILVRKGKIEDFIVPTDNIYFQSGKYGGWRYKDLTVTNADVSLLLSLEIEEVANDYIFNFNKKEIVTVLEETEGE